MLTFIVLWHGGILHVMAGIFILFLFYLLFFFRRGGSVLYEGRRAFEGACSHVGELYFMTRSLGVLGSTGIR